MVILCPFGDITMTNDLFFIVEAFFWLTKVAPRRALCGNTTWHREVDLQTARNIISSRVTLR